MATSHGWVSREPAPKAPAEDNRSFIIELFMHDDGTMCELGAQHEHDYLTPAIESGVPGYRCHCGNFNPLPSGPDVQYESL